MVQVRDYGTIASFVLCTVFSILTDVITKNILAISRTPVTLTLLQFGSSSVCGFLVLYVFKLHPAQPLKLENLKRIFPLMLFQATGFLFANYSVASVAVSFMHTVKSSESAFTAALSYLVLGQAYTLNVYISLLPMIIGVLFSSLSEFSFNLQGLFTGIASNICFSCRSVFSEALFETRLYDDVNLYWIMCSGAFALVLPLWAMTDIPFFASEGLPSNLMEYFWKLVLCGVLHYIYNMFSFMILSRTSPLTHVVLHAVRRIIVIFFSIIWFGNVVSSVNILGMGLVFVGVFWYATEKASFNKKKHAK